MVSRLSAVSSCRSVVLMSSTSCLTHVSLTPQHTIACTNNTCNRCDTHAHINNARWNRVSWQRINVCVSRISIRYVNVRWRSAHHTPLHPHHTPMHRHQHHLPHANLSTIAVNICADVLRHVTIEQQTPATHIDASYLHPRHLADCLLLFDLHVLELSLSALRDTHLHNMLCYAVRSHHAMG